MDDTYTDHTLALRDPGEEEGKSIKGFLRP